MPIIALRDLSSLNLANALIAFNLVLLGSASLTATSWSNGIISGFWYSSTVDKTEFISEWYCDFPFLFTYLPPFKDYDLNTITRTITIEIEWRQTGKFDTKIV